MKILIGYDGSDSADTAIDGLQRAGLPTERVEALARLLSLTHGAWNTELSHTTKELYPQCSPYPRQVISPREMDELTLSPVGSKVRVA